MVVLPLSGEASYVHTKPFVVFADGKLRRLQVAGDLQLNSSYRAPQPILQRQIDGLSRLSWMSLDRVWLLWVHNLT
jgi:hypothetical protein